MTRPLKEAQMTTRNARAGLPIGVHWRRLDDQVHLGYRKGKRSGVWLVRWRHGKGYRQEPLGTADDALKEGTLDFHTASKKACEHVNGVRYCGSRHGGRSGADGAAGTRELHRYPRRARQPA